MENISPASDGKAAAPSQPKDNSFGKDFRQSAEEAFDKIADEHGIDDNGDPVVDIDDDEPAPVEGATEDPVAEQVAESKPEYTETEEVPAEATAQAPEVKIPPQTWPKEWKDTFSSLPDEAQATMLEMNGKMNAGFTHKMTELSKMRRDLDGVTKALAPHHERLARAGISPDIAIQRALGWDAYIQRDPVRGLQDYAQALGVDLNQAIQPKEQRYLTPEERATQQQLSQMGRAVQQQQSVIQQWQQHQQRQDWQQRQSNAYSLLDQFMNAKDDKGNLKHPYIEHLAPMMTDMIRRGVTQDLGEAYEIAQVRSPDIRQALEAKRKASQLQENKRKVDKARKASGGIVDKSGKAPKPGMSFEERASRNYDKIVNA